VSDAGASGPGRARTGPRSGPRSGKDAAEGPAGLATRKAAVDLIYAVLSERRSLDDSLAHHTEKGSLARLAPRDRAHARLIVATTLRRLGQIDAVLAVFLAKGLPEERGRLREILQTAAAQLLFLEAAPHAVVSLAVSLAQRDNKARRYEKLVNAVLRRVSEQGPGLVAAQDAARLDTPDWLWESWTAAYGAETAREIAQSHLSEAALDISVRGDPERWARALDGELLSTGTIRRAAEGRIEDLPGFAEGQWWVQDCAAALPVRLLGDIRGQRVLDLCAAPGGKTAQLAAAGAEVTALDISKARMDRLGRNLARLGLQAELVVADAAVWTPAEPFDCVVLDAPCTATGTIRRHPDIAHLKQAGDVDKLARLQQTLLRHAAATLVKPGGTLIFCTCSLQPEEGPDRVVQALAENPQLKLSAVAPAEVGGVEPWVTREGYLRTLPSQAPLRRSGEETPELRGVDGFFAARMIRGG
jgi:16S rRNA (cytosine967-C5)-methyltransferase